MWKVSFLMLRISFSLNPTAAVAVVALEPLKSFDREVTDGCVRSCAALVWALWLRHQSRTQERKIRSIIIARDTGENARSRGSGRRRLIASLREALGAMKIDERVLNWDMVTALKESHRDEKRTTTKQSLGYKSNIRHSRPGLTACTLTNWTEQSPENFLIVKVSRGVRSSPKYRLISPRIRMRI